VRGIEPNVGVVSAFVFVYLGLAILQTLISSALIKSPGETKIWEPRSPALIEINGNSMALSSKKMG
jgi:hypothetical protein